LDQHTACTYHLSFAMNISAGKDRMQNLPLGNTYWPVYREKATIAPFDAISHEVELAQEFRGLVKGVLVARSDSSSLMNL
jgi:hypothetical protein